MGPQEIEAGEWLANQFNTGEDPFKEHNANLQMREKTLSSDLEHFMQLIRNNCYDNPPSCVMHFTNAQAKEIIEYEQTTYFKHFNLYKYCSDEKQTEKVKVEQIMIDEPQGMTPLLDFEEIIEEKPEEEQHQEEEEKVDEQAEQE